jgi:hypothetical protein
MNRFHGIVGQPELDAQLDFRLTHRYIRIDAESGFRGLDLAQLDGTLLALDWVVGRTHHIWGSAVMVAPGVALTARHIVDDMRDKGFLGNVGGYLLAFGFHNDGMTIWNPNSFGSLGDGDLSILTLVQAVAPPAPASSRSPRKERARRRGRSSNKVVGLATLVARQPTVGESISLIGFAASEIESENDAGLDLLGSVGQVIDVYPEGRDRRLPNPSAAVSAKTIGGMSGGAAFDAQGRLIGIIASGIGEDPSHCLGPACLRQLKSLGRPDLFESLQVCTICLSRVFAASSASRRSFHT